MNKKYVAVHIINVLSSIYSVYTFIETHTKLSIIFAIANGIAAIYMSDVYFIKPQDKDTNEL